MCVKFRKVRTLPSILVDEIQVTFIHPSKRIEIDAIGSHTKIESKLKKDMLSVHIRLISDPITYIYRIVLIGK